MDPGEVDNDGRMTLGKPLLVLTTSCCVRPATHMGRYRVAHRFFFNESNMYEDLECKWSVVNDDERSVKKYSKYETWNNVQMHGLVLEAILLLIMDRMSLECLDRNIQFWTEKLTTVMSRSI